MKEKEKISFKEINKLAIPAILAGIAEPLISIADSAIVGHLGTEELGAVGISTSFFLLMVWGLSSMKSAISSIVANYYGKNELSEIKTLIPQAIVISTLIGLICYFVTVPISTSIFQFYEAKGKILILANDYFVIRAIGFPLTLATFSIFGVFRGYQNTVWAMIISLVGAAINVFLDYSMVYGEFGFVQMGVEGAAWASVISQVFMLVSALVMLKIKLPNSYTFSIKPNKEMKQLLGMGGNLFLRTFALNIAYYLGNRFATSYGDEYIAAHTIAMNIWLFSSFFIDGYANAGNAIAGKIMGQGNKKLLYNTGIRIVRISMLIGLMLSAVYSLSYYYVVDFFTSDESVKTIFWSVFWMVIISQPINAISFALDGIFKGLGRAALLRNTLVLGTFLVYLPIIYLADYFNWQVFSIWTAFIFWMAFRGGSLLVVFRREFN